MGKKPRKGKGFVRTAKQWQNSIATHIGKITDNMTGKDLLDILAAITCAYAGYNATVQLGATDIKIQIGGAATGLMAYQLAKQPNLVAGASGTATLAALGLINIWNPLTNFVTSLAGPTYPQNVLNFPMGWGAQIVQ